MKSTILYPKTRTTRSLFKRVPIPGQPGAFSQEADGIEELYYETTIDHEELHQLARDAARNKRGQAKDGPLHIRILERRKL
jgi:hypothetical protein